MGWVGMGFGLLYEFANGYGKGLWEWIWIWNGYGYGTDMELEQEHNNDETMRGLNDGNVCYEWIWILILISQWNEMERTG